MKTIYCENKYLHKGKKTRCGRWLGRLTDLQIDILRIDPEARCNFRCPACPPQSRWKEISYENDNYIFKICEKPDRENSMSFDIVEISEEVA